MGTNSQKDKNFEEANSKVNELSTGHKPIPINVIIKVMKSICKIIIQIGKGRLGYGTGFFMKFKDTKKYLITNYHVISRDMNFENISIEIYNHKKFELNFNNRYIKYYPQPKDITIIEIQSADKIYKDIELLDYDLNYKKGYKIYENVDIFSIEHPLGENAACASGKIINIDNFEFDHDISTDNGSSGCPIILLNNNINSVQVIGIHKYADRLAKLNCGTFIGEIFEEDINNLNDIIIDCKPDRNIISNNINNASIDYNNNKNIIVNDYNIISNGHNDKDQDYSNIKYTNNNIDDGNNNYCIKTNNCLHIYDNKILAEIEIKKEDTDKRIRIINSFEENARYNPWLKINANMEEKNEDEIKQCEIRINDKLVPFNYFYIFKKKGIYKIKYHFNNNLTNASYMFYDCECLISINLTELNATEIKDIRNMFEKCRNLKSINLSNWNSKKLTNMDCLFSQCISLTNLDLSNFNTENVTYMSYMFSKCTSLKKVYLSNFDIQKVQRMTYMFELCRSLEKIELHNFNTQNVIDMSHMFYGCESLKDIVLGNFNNKKLIYMKSMFSGCKKLTNAVFWNFNTENVENMSFLFEGCKSLKYLDLSCFDTKNVKDTYCMFISCESLTYLNLTNFNTQSVFICNGMFDGCHCLKKENIITHDENIFNLFEENHHNLIQINNDNNYLIS